MADLAERDTNRNIFLLGTDYATFSVAMALLGPTTVLPALVRLLGGGPLAVGALGAIVSGGWLLPQLFAGRYLVGRALLKRFILIPGFGSRVFLALMALAVFWLGGRAPGLALVALLGGFLAFTIGDSLSSVPWIDLIGKAVPIQRRGRALGTWQVAGNLMAIGSGVAVRLMLARPGGLLDNYALLIALAAALFTIGPVATSQVREPRGKATGEGQLPWREYLPRLAAIGRRDARFVWLIGVRWLSGLADMGSAFYVLYAADRLHVPQATAGLFVSAGVVGGLCSGIILGWLSDRKGSVQVITAIMLLRCSCPALALALPAVAGRAPQLGLPVFLLIFGLAGMANGGYMLGYTNYLLEIAPSTERSLYIALANTLGGVVVLAPLVAAWLVQGSYELLFGVVLGLGLAGLVVAVRGPARAPEMAPAVEG